MRLIDAGMTYEEKLAMYLTIPNPSIPETYYNEMFAACSKPDKLLTIRLASRYMLLFLYRLMIFEPFYVAF
jgi:hypothetical protein